METGEGTDELGASFLSIDAQSYMVHDPDDDTDHLGGDGGDDDGGEKSMHALREQDRFLPIANVARIMKKAIPSNGKIAKDARECVQECVSEFISFITSEASDRCHQEKRKTINGEDILFAMSTLGFDGYVEPLKLYLQKYREAMKGDKVSPCGGDGFDDIGDDAFGSSTLTSSILTDQNGQQESVIYAYSSDLPQFQLS